MPVIRSPFSPGGPSSSQPSVPASRSTRAAGEDFSSYISRLTGREFGPVPQPMQQVVEQVDIPARLSPPRRGTLGTGRPVSQRRVQETEPPQPDTQLDLSNLLRDISTERREERGPEVAPEDFVSESDVRDAAAKARTELAGMFSLPEEQRQQVREQIEQIEIGEAATTGGIAGLAKGLFELLPSSVEDPVKEGASGALQTAGQFVETFFRGLQSYAKELTDFFTEGQETSFADLTRQTIGPLSERWGDPDFDPEYKPIQDTAQALFGKDLSGNDWVSGFDTALELGVRIGADPTTYTILTPLKYQSAAGRSAAAQDFLRSVTAVPLDDAVKAQYAADIYRYGPNYLPTSVRDSLVREGIFEPAGIRIAGQTVPGTEGVSETLGASISAARARFGDIGGGATATAMTPGSLIGLTDIARGANMSAEEVLDAFAIHASTMQAKADARQLAGDLAGSNERWMRQADTLSPEESRMVIDFAEGIINDVPDNLRQIAEAYRRMTRDEALARFNAQRLDISQRRGLRLDEVTPRDNWFHRTTTSGAKALFRSNKKRNGLDGNAISRLIGRDLGLSTQQLGRAEGFTMARRDMDTFLGETLVHGGRSTTELNDIFRAKYGVDLFEENVGINGRKYLTSLVRQFERQSFVDNIFRFRPSQIKPLLSTNPSAQEVRTVIDGFESVLRSVDKLIVGTGEGTAKAGAKDFMESIIAGIRNASDRNFLKSSRARANVKRLRNRLAQLESQIAEVSGRAARSTSDAQDEFLTVVGPLESRIRSLRSAIDTGEGEIALAEDWLRAKYAQVFLDTAGMPSGPAGIANQLDRWALQNLSGAALKSNREAIARRRAQAIKRGREIDVKGVRENLSAAKKELEQKQRQVTAAEGAFNSVVANDPDVKNLRSLKRKRDSIASKLDTASALAGLWDVWEQEVGILYRFDIAKIRAIIAEMPGANIRVTKAVDPADLPVRNRVQEDLDAVFSRVFPEGGGARPPVEPPKGKLQPSTQQSIAWLEKVDETMRNLPTYGLDEGELDTLTRVMSQLFSLESDVAFASMRSVQWSEVEDRVRKGLIDGSWVQDLETGWKGIEALQAQVSPRLSRRLAGDVEDDFIDNALNALGDPVNRSLLVEMYDANLRYFKSTAILTAGFTVRNALTAAFNNIVYGVTRSQFREGRKFAIDAWRRGPEEAIKRLPENQRARYEAAWRMVIATGGGRMIDEIVPVIGRDRNRFNNRVASAAYTVGDYVFRPFSGRLSAGARRLNENVEIGVRMPLALNAVDKGFSLEAGAARIARVQFDYTDLSALDRVAKRIIPFWVFASRNIPLQLVNQAVRPGPYRAYEKLRESGDENDGRLPRWRVRQMPVPVGDWFLNLDLPFVAVGEDIEGLTSLSGLAGQASPLPRALVEYITGQRIAFGTSYPYSEDYRQIGVTDFPGVLLGAVSDRGEALKQGLVKEKDIQIAGGALPALQNIQRYIAAISQATGLKETGQRVLGGPEDYFERDALLTGLKAVGIDVFQPTRATESQERRRIIAEINDLMREQGRIAGALSE